jgi:serine/threonine protein phosphatase PrpC
LLTHDFAVVRTLSRQGWDIVMQQPFQSRQFSAQELAGWIPVNNGQLLGFTSQKGGQPRLASQDEYAVLHEAGYQIYLVVDGHGENGEAVAKFVRRWLVNALQNMVRQRDDRVLANGELTRLFSELHQTALKAEASLENAFRCSGCTAAVAVVTPTRSLRGAWLGNCQCVVGRRDDIWAARSLTPPHEGPSNGLPVPVARAIGDFSHESLGHEAEEFVEADIDQSGLDFLIMGTGGLWRGLSQVRIVEEVAKAGPYFAQHACSRVAMLSQDNQMKMQPGPGPMGVEDATIIVVWVGGNVSESEVKQ